jgi:tetratricopeptide (TPR) repeat protein
MKQWIMCATLLCTVAGFAQKKGQEVPKKETNNLGVVTYQNALKYGDAATAIQSLHQIIAQEGAQSTYKDSLAILYYRANNFVSAHLVAKELLVQKPQDATLLEINAVSLRALGASKEAIDGFEKLLTVSKNRFHAYELAQLQFGIARMAEAMLTLNQAMVNTQELETKVVFNIDKERQQEVPLNAAMLNLKGIIAFEMKDEKGALASFEEALKIMPDFAMAQLNKMSLEQKQTEDYKPQGSKTTVKK